MQCSKNKNPDVGYLELDQLCFWVGVFFFLIRNTVEILFGKMQEFLNSMCHNFILEHCFSVVVQF